MEVCIKVVEVINHRCLDTQVDRLRNPNIDKPDNTPTDKSMECSAYPDMSDFCSPVI